MKKRMKMGAKNLSVAERLLALYPLWNNFKKRLRIFAMN
jgi:hypothetical protein